MNPAVTVFLSSCSLLLPFFTDKYPEVIIYIPSLFLHLPQALSHCNHFNNKAVPTILLTPTATDPLLEYLTGSSKYTREPELILSPHITPLPSFPVSGNYSTPGTKP